MLKILLIAFSLLLLSGCAAKEIQKDVVVLEKECAKPTLDMTKFGDPKSVKIMVDKGMFVVTIKNSDYIKMKETNQDLKDKYITLRSWVIQNIKSGLIKNRFLLE